MMTLTTEDDANDNTVTQTTGSNADDNDVAADIDAATKTTR
jgi:hypothetical protein